MMLFRLLCFWKLRIKTTTLTIILGVIFIIQSSIMPITLVAQTQYSSFNTSSDYLMQTSSEPTSPARHRSKRSTNTVNSVDSFLEWLISPHMDQYNSIGLNHMVNRIDKSLNSFEKQSKMILKDKDNNKIIMFDNDDFIAKFISLNGDNLLLLIQNIDFQAYQRTIVYDQNTGTYKHDITKALTDYNAKTFKDLAKTKLEQFKKANQDFFKLYFDVTDEIGTSHAVKSRANKKKYALNDETHTKLKQLFKDSLLSEVGSVNNTKTIASLIDSSKSQLHDIQAIFSISDFNIIKNQSRYKIYLDNISTLFSNVILELSSDKSKNTKIALHIKSKLSDIVLNKYPTQEEMFLHLSPEQIVTKLLKTYKDDTIASSDFQKSIIGDKKFLIKLSHNRVIALDHLKAEHLSLTDMMVINDLISEYAKDKQDDSSDKFMQEVKKNIYTAKEVKKAYQAVRQVNLQTFGDDETNDEVRIIYQALEITKKIPKKDDELKIYLQDINNYNQELLNTLLTDSEKKISEDSVIKSDKINDIIAAFNKEIFDENNNNELKYPKFIPLFKQNDQLLDIKDVKSQFKSISENIIYFNSYGEFYRNFENRVKINNQSLIAKLSEDQETITSDINYKTVPTKDISTSNINYRIFSTQLHEIIKIQDSLLSDSLLSVCKNDQTSKHCENNFISDIAKTISPKNVQKKIIDSAVKSIDFSNIGSSQNTSERFIKSLLYERRNFIKNVIEDIKKFQDNRIPDLIILDYIEGPDLFTNELTKILPKEILEYIGKDKYIAFANKITDSKKLIKILPQFISEYLLHKTEDSVNNKAKFMSDIYDRANNACFNKDSVCKNKDAEVLISNIIKPLGSSGFNDYDFFAEKLITGLKIIDQSTQQEDNAKSEQQVEKLFKKNIFKNYKDFVSADADKLLKNVNPKIWDEFYSMIKSGIEFNSDINHVFDSQKGSSIDRALGELFINANANEKDDLIPVVLNFGDYKKIITMKNLENIDQIHKITNDSKDFNKESLQALRKIMLFEDDDSKEQNKTSEMIGLLKYNYDNESNNHKFKYSDTMPQSSAIMKAFAGFFGQDISNITDIQEKKKIIKAENQTKLIELFNQVLVASNIYNNIEYAPPHIDIIKASLISSYYDSDTNSNFRKHLLDTLIELPDSGDGAFYHKFNDKNGRHLFFIRSEKDDSIGDVEFAYLISKEHLKKNINQYIESTRNADGTISVVANNLYYILRSDEVMSKLKILLYENPQLAAKITQYKLLDKSLIDASDELNKIMEKNAFLHSPKYTIDSHRWFSVNYKKDDIIGPASNKNDLVRFSNGFMYVNQIPTIFADSGNEKGIKVNFSHDDILFKEYDFWISSNLPSYDEIIINAFNDLSNTNVKLDECITCKVKKDPEIIQHVKNIVSSFKRQIVQNRGQASDKTIDSLVQEFDKIISENIIINNNHTLALINEFKNTAKDTDIKDISSLINKFKSGLLFTPNTVLDEVLSMLDSNLMTQINLNAQHPQMSQSYLARRITRDLSKEYHIVDLEWHNKKKEIIDEFKSGIANVILAEQIRKRLSHIDVKDKLIYNLGESFKISNKTQLNKIQKHSLDSFFTIMPIEKVAAKDGNGKIPLEKLGDKLITIIDGNTKSLKTVSEINEFEWLDIAYGNKQIAVDDQILSVNFADFTGHNKEDDRNILTEKVKYFQDNKNQSFSELKKLVIKYGKGKELSELLKSKTILNQVGISKIHISNISKQEDNIGLDVSPLISSKNDRNFLDLLAALSDEREVHYIMPIINNQSLLDWLFSDEAEINVKSNIEDKTKGSLLELMDFKDKHFANLVKKFADYKIYVDDRIMLSGAKLNQSVQSNKVKYVKNILSRNIFNVDPVQIYKSDKFKSITASVKKGYKQNTISNIFNHQNITNVSDLVSNIGLNSVENLSKLLSDKINISAIVSMIRKAQPEVVIINNDKKVTTWMNDKEVSEWISNDYDILKALLDDALIGHELKKVVTKLSDESINRNNNKLLISLQSMNLDKIKDNFDGNLVRDDFFDKMFKKQEEFIINCETCDQNFKYGVVEISSIPQNAEEKLLVFRHAVFHNPNILTQNPKFYAKANYYLIQNDAFVDTYLAKEINNSGVIFMPWALTGIVKKHLGIDNLITRKELITSYKKFLSKNSNRNYIKVAQTIGDNNLVKMHDLEGVIYKKSISELNQILAVKVGFSPSELNELSGKTYHRNIQPIKDLAQKMIINPDKYASTILLDSNKSRHFFKDFEDKSASKILTSILNIMQNEGSYKPNIGRVIKPFISESLSNIIVHKMLQQSTLVNGIKFDYHKIYSNFTVASLIDANMPNISYAIQHNLNDDIIIKLNGIVAYANINNAILNTHKELLFGFNISSDFTLNLFSNINANLYLGYGSNIIDDYNTYDAKEISIGTNVRYNYALDILNLSINGDLRYRKSNFYYQSNIDNIIDDLSTNAVDMRLGINLNKTIDFNKFNIMFNIYVNGGLDLIRNDHKIIETGFNVMLDSSIVALEMGYGLHNYIDNDLITDNYAVQAYHNFHLGLTFNIKK